MLLTLVALVVLGQNASADKVDRLISRLNSKNYKVRLSAAVSLAKIGDPRAIGPLVRRMKDRKNTVRGVAAASLAKLIRVRTPRAVRRTAMNALEQAADNDRDAFVRRQAKQALATLSGKNTTRGRRIYIDIGKMSAQKGGGRMRRVMRKTVQDTFAKKTGTMTTAWSSGRPTKAQLRARGMQGFHIDGSLVRLTRKPQGAGVLVSCKVKMLMATFPEKSMFAFPSGGAKVQASASDASDAEQDCVSAVLEALVATKVIPLLQARASN